MPITHLAVVMPAYNEREGLPGFLSEIREHLAPLVERLTIVVADDRSTDGTVATLEALHDDGLVIAAQPQNRGHGPTALAAYRAGLALDPELLVHVDGDGQFLGRDMARLVTAMASTGADVVHGVRDGRTDPWFRKVLTGALHVLVAFAAGRRIPDVNTPLRGYRPAALSALLDAVPDETIVPHVHFSLAEARWGLDVRYLLVRSIPRRGSAETGTMWGKVSRPSLPPKRLRAFVRSALGEVWQLSLRPHAPLRSRP